MASAEYDSATCARHTAPDSSAVSSGCRVGAPAPGKEPGMESTDTRPGPLEPEKRTGDAEGQVQPEAAEVESARLLANDAGDRLRPRGLDDEQIRRLADEFIARDRGEAVDDFVAWAEQRERHHGGEPPAP